MLMSKCGKIFMLIALFFVIFAAIILSACEVLDPIPIVASNQTNEALTVYFKAYYNNRPLEPKEVKVGIIEPGETWRKYAGISIVGADEIVIYATNKQGLVVFSKEYSWDEYDRAKWSVEITAAA